MQVSHARSASACLVLLKVFLALGPGVTAAPAASSSPVIILPGDGGSQIQGRWDRPEPPPHWYCSSYWKKQSEWTNLYLALSDFIPGEIDCWADTFRLVFNESSGTFSNAPGVETRVPGFGNTSSIEYLDPDLHAGTSYFAPLVDFLVEELGYVRGHSVRGAPYDHRLAPRSNGAFLNALKALVEDTYTANGGTPVTLVSHSMGCIYTLHFLHHRSPAWKDKYIHQWVSIAGVFGGSAEEVGLMASGNAPVPIINALSVREEQRSDESNVWMLPLAGEGLWGPDDVVASTPDRNYTALDYKDFFHDIGYPEGYEIWTLVNNLTQPQKPPGVRMSCLYSSGVETVEGFAWSDMGSFPDKGSKKITSNQGDGTVNLRSLEACVGWRARQAPLVSTFQYWGVAHRDLVSQPATFEVLAGAVALRAGPAPRLGPTNQAALRRARTAAPAALATRPPLLPSALSPRHRKVGPQTAEPVRAAAAESGDPYVDFLTPAGYNVTNHTGDPINWGGTLSVRRKDNGRVLVHTTFDDTDGDVLFDVADARDGRKLCSVDSRLIPLDSAPDPIVFHEAGLRCALHRDRSQTRLYRVDVSALPNSSGTCAGPECGMPHRGGDRAGASVQVQ